MRTEPSILILPTNSSRPSGCDALKQEYLSCFATALAASVATLRAVVNRLRASGINRSTLVEWAVETGYSTAYVRSILSQIWTRSGGRIRRSGAGPKTPKEALELLALASERYRGKAEKFLRAAARAAKRQRLEARRQLEPALAMA